MPLIIAVLGFSDKQTILSYKCKSQLATLVSSIYKGRAGRGVSTLGQIIHDVSQVFTFCVQISPKSTVPFTLSV